MTPHETWRLRLRTPGDDGEPGDILGTGFTVTDHTALTCAHVVKDLKECWVEPLDNSIAAQRCRLSFLASAIDEADGSSDIAVISLRNSVPPAQLGPYDPPVSGTEIEVVGYVESYLDWGRTQVTRGRVLGQPGQGYLQVGSLDEYPPIAQGYSGGGAVDVGSGRVVGMIAQVVDAHRIAWMIPLATIASRWPPLGEYLPKGLQADREFKRAYEELRHAHYVDALYRFGEVSKSYPYEADIYYYRVLAALGGRRPGGYQGAVIEQMEQVLDYALQLQPNSPHVQALLRLVEEDYYSLRGLKPRKIRSYSDIQEISPVHAREITHHVAARECRTWQLLNSFH